MISIADAEFIAGQMAGGADHPEFQLTQTRFRIRLVENWGIPSGAKVLEVGCGQGDMTAVLAHTVGREGHVTATDIAEPQYGAPITLGQASEHLKTTALGQ
jgi:protein-L-isoaspartate O-methyltransferase